MDTMREKTDHLLALTVMRLARPTLLSPIVVTTDARDLPGDSLNSQLKSDLMSVAGSETVASGQFLLLPQSFGNIYLGETFSSCICVHNDSNQIAKDVIVKARLQTKNNNIMLSADPPTSTDLLPGATVDEVIHHEVKEFGTHVLVCEVSYCCGTLSSDLLCFNKFFRFEVSRPLDVKTKLYTTVSEEVYLEAQVKNITSGPLSLETVSLEPSPTYEVSKLNTTQMLEEFQVDIMPPKTSKQFLYCLSPLPPSGNDSKPRSTCIGKLDIIWRSNLGEKGRLQTSPLCGTAPQYGELRLSVLNLPNIVYLEEAFEISCKVTNTSERSMELILLLTSSDTIEWCAVSGKKLGVVSPGGFIKFKLMLLILAPGIQQISGVKLRDPFLKRTHDYDEIAHVLVTEREQPITEESEE